MCRNAFLICLLLTLMEIFIFYRLQNIRTFTDNYGTEGTLSIVINPKLEPNKFFQGAMGLRVKHLNHVQF